MISLISLTLPPILFMSLLLVIRILKCLPFHSNFISFFNFYHCTTHLYQFCYFISDFWSFIIFQSIGFPQLCFLCFVSVISVNHFTFTISTIASSLSKASRIGGGSRAIARIFPKESLFSFSEGKGANRKIIVFYLEWSDQLSCFPNSNVKPEII